jgi:hypothetical protein
MLQLHLGVSSNIAAIPLLDPLLCSSSTGVYLMPAAIPNAQLPDIDYINLPNHVLRLSHNTLRIVKELQ